MTTQSKLRYGELAAVLAMLGVLLYLLAYIALSARSGAETAACMNNLKQLGAAFRVYADENRDRYPALTNRYRIAPEEGEAPWLFLSDERALFPDYGIDPAWFICPATPGAESLLAKGGDWTGLDGAFDPDRMTDASYVYTGYLVVLPFHIDLVIDTVLRPNVGTGAPVNERFARGTIEMVADMIRVPNALGRKDSEKARVIRQPHGFEAIVPNRSFPSHLPPLQNGVERFLMPDLFCGYRVMADVPLLWEAPHHDVSGIPHGHALFMAGHVEFIAEGRDFPMGPAPNLGQPYVAPPAHSTIR